MERHTPAPGTEPDPLLSLTEAADYLRISRATLYRLTAAREIPVVRISERRRGVRQSALDAYVAAKTDEVVA